MIFESLKEKCKYYQSLYDYKLLPNSYVIVHLDGKNFSKVIKNNFELPFDDNFINMMNETTKYLCENVQNVEFAYTQSDEITLIIPDNTTIDLPFKGRICKLQSILASMASTKFNQLYLINKVKAHQDKFETNEDICNFIEDYDLVEFDCKVWSVPTLNDVKAWLIFRQNDCVRNSRQQTAQTYCSYKELLNKDSKEQVNYLKEKTGIDWETFPMDKKYGRIFRKVQVEKQKEINGEIITFMRNAWEMDSKIMNFINNDEEKNKD